MKTKEEALEAAANFIEKLDKDALVELSNNGTIFMNWYIENSTFSKESKEITAQKIYDEVLNS